jgi:hypothetical protein
MEWVDRRKVAEVSGRNIRNVYYWARKGYVRSKVVVTSPRQKRGKTVFLLEDVVNVAERIGQGARLDLFPVEDYVRKPYVAGYRFTDEQLAVARKVFGYE